MVMPFLASSLAGEILYILDQRLASQEVVEGKAWLFFGDVIRRLFDPVFISQLCQPQPIYPISAIKSIFEKALKSGVIQMNRNSLDKLFDMSMMSVKSQIGQCASGREIIQVSLNHIFEIRSICASHEALLLDKFVAQLVKISASLTLADFVKLRHSVLTFLSEKREKISVLLKSNTQDDDGCLIAKPGGNLSPGVFAIPGSVKLVNQGGKIFQLLPPSKSTELWSILPEPFRSGNFSILKLYSPLGLSVTHLKIMRHSHAMIPQADSGSDLEQIKLESADRIIQGSVLTVPEPIKVEISAPQQKLELNEFAAALRKARAPRQLSSSVNQWNTTQVDASPSESVSRPGKLSGADIIQLMDALK